jgi:pullulanase/glycogen debranching enzyme
MGDIVSDKITEKAARAVHRANYEGDWDEAEIERHWNEYEDDRENAFNHASAAIIVYEAHLRDVTPEMIAAGRAAWQSAIKDKNLDLWLAHIYTVMREAALAAARGGD